MLIPEGARCVRAARVLCLLAIVAMVGCGKKEKTPLDAKAEVQPGGVVLSVKTSPKTEVSYTFIAPEGMKKSWKWSLESGTWSETFRLKAGAYKVRITAQADEKGKATEVLSFTIKNKDYVEYSIEDNSRLGVKCELVDQAASSHPRYKPEREVPVIGADGRTKVKVHVRNYRTLEFGGQPYKLEEGKNELMLDLRGALGPIPLKTLVARKAKWRLQAPIVVKTASTSKTHILRCAPKVTAWIGKAVAKGGLRFKGDKGKTDQGRSVLVTDNGTRLWHLGADVKLQDVDRVAVLDTKLKSYKPCRYRGVKSGRRKEVSRTAWNIEARVYDRRTGKLLGKKFFKARKPGCKAIIKGSDYFSTSASFVEAAAWVKKEYLKK